LAGSFYIPFLNINHLALSPTQLVNTEVCRYAEYETGKIRIGTKSRDIFNQSNESLLEYLACFGVVAQHLVRIGVNLSLKYPYQFVESLLVPAPEAFNQLRYPLRHIAPYSPTNPETPAGEILFNAITTV
jgi:hypothetical protein